MPSISLIPSQTAVSMHNFPSLHEANQGETTVSHRRRSFLKHVNGLWKGLPPGSKKKSTSDCVLPQASSPSGSGPTLVLESISTPPHLTFSPPSPTIQTPLSLPCDDAEVGWPWITVAGTEAAADMTVRSARSLYPPDMSRAKTEPLPEPLKRHMSLSENSGLSCMASPAIGASGSIPDAATRLQDFRSLIVEMRASLMDRDGETLADAGGHDEEEIERLLRLLEDVMRKVRGLAERETGFGVPLIKIHPAP